MSASEHPMRVPGQNDPAPAPAPATRRVSWPHVVFGIACAAWTVFCCVMAARAPSATSDIPPPSAGWMFAAVFGLGGLAIACFVPRAP